MRQVFADMYIDPERVIAVSGKQHHAVDRTATDAMNGAPQYTLVYANRVHGTTHDLMISEAAAKEIIAYLAGVDENKSRRESLSSLFCRNIPDDKLAEYAIKGNPPLAYVADAVGPCASDADIAAMRKEAE